ncbi:MULTISPECIES: hypothetical protein [unclassified Cedecea]|uniref:hypothetical protein n=1 Tax=unclassified Cedecea TaxID=2649846 RepID=UPI003015D6BD
MNNLSSSFTIEDLREIAYRGSYSDSERAMARELLALREAGKEPVGIRWRFTDWRKTTMLHHTFDVDRFDEFSKSGNKEVYYTYAAPQLPAVTTEMAQAGGIVVAECEAHGEHQDDTARKVFAAMIAAAPKPE